MLLRRQEFWTILYVATVQGIIISRGPALTFTSAPRLSPKYSHGHVTAVTLHNFQQKASFSHAMQQKETEGMTRDLKKEVRGLAKDLLLSQKKSVDLLLSQALPQLTTLVQRKARSLAPQLALLAIVFTSSAASAESVCLEPYGLLPCSSSLGGNVFLLAAFGYVLFTAAGLIAEGSELLLEVMDPGVVGGLLLPVLGAFADVMIVIASAVGGTVEEAQEEVAVGLGVLAGSTVMLLTIAWAGSLWAGRCDLSGPGGTAVDKQLSPDKKYSFSETGITHDSDTRNGALIMGATCIPYLLVQLPLITGRSEDAPLVALAGAVTCAASFVAYSGYSIYFPVLQKKKIAEARYKIARDMSFRRVERAALSFGGMLDADGAVNEQGLTKMFRSFDLDKSGKLSRHEVEQMLVVLAMAGGSQRIPDSEAEVRVWLQDFDVDASGCIDLVEFKLGIAKWMRAIRQQNAQQAAADLAAAQALVSAADIALEELETIREVEEGEEGELMAPDAIYQKAGLLLLAGIGLVVAFADPMVDAVGNFGKAAGIPPFFVAFVVTPFASNASEVVSSFLFASKKRKRTISLTYSQIYGAITMNNSLCLGIFLALVYARGLTWDFSAEVTAITATVLCMTAVGASRTTFPTGFVPPVLAIYPAVIVAILGMENVLGWH